MANSFDSFVIDWNTNFFSTVLLIIWLAGRSRTRRMFQMNQFPMWNKLHFSSDSKIIVIFFLVIHFFEAENDKHFLLLINNERRLNRCNMIPSEEHHVTEYITSCRIDFDLVILSKNYYYVIILNISFVVHFIIAALKCTATIERFNIEHWNILHKWANILHIVRIAVQTSFHIHFFRTWKFQWQRRTWGIFSFFFRN